MRNTYWKGFRIFRSPLEKCNGKRSVDIDSTDVNNVIKNINISDDALQVNTVIVELYPSAFTEAGFKTLGDVFSKK